MNNFTIIIFSIILAIIVYFLLFDMYVYKGPNSNIIKKKIFIENGKKYRLMPHIFMCPNY